MELSKECEDILVLQASLNLITLLLNLELVEIAKLRKDKSSIFVAYNKYSSNIQRIQLFKD